jgi:hypothetical protein
MGVAATLVRLPQKATDPAIPNHTSYDVLEE